MRPSWLYLDVTRLHHLPVRSLFMHNTSHASTSRNSPRRRLQVCQEQPEPAGTLLAGPVPCPTGFGKNSALRDLFSKRWKNAPLQRLCGYNEAEQLWGRKGHQAIMGFTSCLKKRLHQNVKSISLHPKMWFVPGTHVNDSFKTRE